MNQPKHDSSRPATITVVAPAWLLDPLTVLLGAMQGLEVIARAVTVRELLTLAREIERPPDLVLLHAADSDEQSRDQVRRIRAAWPETRCLVLVEDFRQKELIQAACAGKVLLKGAPPERLLTAIRQLLSLE